MQINISARHGNLAQETQQKIENRLQKLSRFHDRISNVRVTIDLDQASKPGIEMLVSVDKANDFFAKTRAEGGNLIGAVDAATNKIEEQLKRYKAKRIGQHRGGSRHEIPFEQGEETE